MTTISPTATPSGSSPAGGSAAPAVAATGAVAGGLAVAANVSAWGQQGLHTVGPLVSKARFLTATGIRVKNDLPKYAHDAVAQEVHEYETHGDHRVSPLERAKARTVGALRGVDELKPRQLVRDAIIGPTSDTTPTTGGIVELPEKIGRLHLPKQIAGKILTRNAWAQSLRWGSGLGAALIGVTLVASALNVTSGVQKQGTSGLLGTYQGRTGLLMGGGALIGLGVNGFAAICRRNPAIVKDGVEIVARQSRRDAFLASDWLQTSKVKLPTYIAGYGFGPALTYNMMGGLNFMNTDKGAQANAPA